MPCVEPFPTSCVSNDPLGLEIGLSCVSSRVYCLENASGIHGKFHNQPPSLAGCPTPGNSGISCRHVDRNEPERKMVIDEEFHGYLQFFCWQRWSTHKKITLLKVPDTNFFKRNQEGKLYSFGGVNITLVGRRVPTRSS